MWREFAVSMSVSGVPDGAMNSHSISLSLPLCKTVGIYLSYCTAAAAAGCPNPRFGLHFGVLHVYACSQSTTCMHALVWGQDEPLLLCKVVAL